MLEANVPIILAHLLDNDKTRQIETVCKTKYKKPPCFHWIDSNLPEMYLAWVEKQPDDMLLESDEPGENQLIYLTRLLGSGKLSTRFLILWTRVAKQMIRGGLDINSVDEER